MFHVALVSSRQHVREDPELPLISNALNQLEIKTSLTVWDDPAIDWSCFNLVVIRSCWDYHSRRDQFLSWARSVPRLVNPYDVIAWNTDKRYLQALSDNGVGIIPTAWTRSEFRDFDASQHWVVKPTISASGTDTVMVSSRAEALDAASRLRKAGKLAMFQPYVLEIEKYGEHALIYIDGKRSHAIRKEALLHTSESPQRIPAREPWESTEVDYDTWSIADDVLRITQNVIASGRNLLYARIDLVLRPPNLPVIMEVELAEPTLFISLCPDAAGTFAQAIERYLHQLGLYVINLGQTGYRPYLLVRVGLVDLSLCGVVDHFSAELAQTDPHVSVEFALEARELAVLSGSTHIYDDPYLIVQLTDGNQGYAFAHPGEITMQSLVDIVGKPICEIKLATLPPWLAVAILDAAIPRLTNLPTPAKELVLSGAADNKSMARANFISDLLLLNDSERVAVIGGIEDIIRQISKSTSGIRIADFHLAGTQLCGIEIENDYKSLLNWCDTVLVTGNILKTDTLAEISEIIQQRSMYAIAYTMTGHNIFPALMSSLPFRWITAETFPFYWFAGSDSTIRAFKAEPKPET